MKVKVKKSNISGTVLIPGSKSHTIRSIYFASLSEGTSVITEPLISADTESAISVCKSFGSKIYVSDNCIKVTGMGKKLKTPDNIIDVGNSGTTLRIGIATAALNNGYTVFTGDNQIRNRPLDSLITALNNLGADIISTRNNGKAPVIVKGPVKGGKTELKATTSQYLSSLLINAPLFENDTEIILTELNEIPYVDITLWWLDKQNIKYENHDYKRFVIYGNQSYRPFEIQIPGDFSSASFFLCLGALSDNEIILDNLDLTDPQGDKEVINILKKMGANINVEGKKVCIRGGNLKGTKIDMNAVPDALPVMAVVGCFAEGVTELVNVPQARLKETDRIAVMKKELQKMGGDIKELESGLVIKNSKLTGTSVSGHHDHRIVMALTVAGLNISGETNIDTAESVNITFPNFFELIKSCNGNVEFNDTCYIPDFA